MPNMPGSMPSMPNMPQMPAMPTMPTMPTMPVQPQVSAWGASPAAQRRAPGWVQGSPTASASGPTTPTQPPWAAAPSQPHLPHLPHLPLCLTPRPRQLNQMTRPMRRLYVGGLPQPCYDFMLTTFLNQALMALGICQVAGKAPIIACQVTPERNFAFIEFGWVPCGARELLLVVLRWSPSAWPARLTPLASCALPPWRPLGAPLTPPPPSAPPRRCSDTSDATAALQLDGIPFRGNTLKIKRPKDYTPPFGVSLSLLGGYRQPAGHVWQAGVLGRPTAACLEGLADEGASWMAACQPLLPLPPELTGCLCLASRFWLAPLRSAGPPRPHPSGPPHHGPAAGQQQHQRRHARGRGGGARGAAATRRPAAARRRLPGCRRCVRHAAGHVGRSPASPGCLAEGATSQVVGGQLSCRVKARPHLCTASCASFSV